MASIYDEAVPVSRRTMVLFFVVDTSGSMLGKKIAELNRAVEEALPEVKDISDSNPDAEIKIAVLQFSHGAKWLTAEPVEVAKYSWVDLKAEGYTDLGAAYRELNAKLSRKTGFMKDEGSGYMAPAILLMSDGVPTDEWQGPLNELRQNGWFKNAIKMAIAIGDDADKDVLKEFTGNSELVITVHTAEALRKWIRFVSVTASKIGSQSSGVGTTPGAPSSKQDDMVKQVEAAAIPDDAEDNF